MVDQQAALAATLTLFHNVIIGSHIVHDVGCLESGLAYSLAQLVICEEILAWIRHSLKPVVTDEAILALDLIDEKGSDGQYIDCERTFDYFREHWYPELWSGTSDSEWSAAGSTTLAEQAAEKVDVILVSHQPKGLPDDVAAAIRGVGSAAINA